MADWAEFAVSGVSEDTPKNIMLGAGTLYKNFKFDSSGSNKWTGTILGLCYIRRHKTHNRTGDHRY